MKVAGSREQGTGMYQGAGNRYGSTVCFLLPDKFLPPVNGKRINDVAVSHG